MSNPYVGPRPLFAGEPLFGRDRELRELRDLLISQGIVVLYSPSGAGKTSLIQAGLVPEMVQADFHVLPVIRLNQRPLAPHRNSANRYVLSAVHSLDAGLSAADQRAPDQLAGMTLAEYLAQRPRQTEMAGSELLIFDQFEEVLTLDPSDQAAKTAFFAQVREMLRQESRWALFSLREDHLAALDPYAASVPTRLKTTYRVALLDPQAARVAIQRPAANAGFEFTDDAAERLVDDLRRIRVQQSDGSTEELHGPFVEPVQLQVVCHRLWNQMPERTNRIDSDLVESLGSVGAALRGFYADCVDAVARETGIPERDVRVWFGERLIAKNGIRSQVLWEPGGGTGLDDRAISMLVDRHLVRAESRRGATWLELAHDRMIEPILADNDDWFPVNLSTLQQLARLWDAQRQAPGYLLTGEALEQAEQWAAEHPTSLTEVDRTFLADSRDHRTRQARERNTQDLAVAQARLLDAERRANEAAMQATVFRRRLVAVALGALAAGAALGAAIVSR